MNGIGKVAPLAARVMGVGTYECGTRPAILSEPNTGVLWRQWLGGSEKLPLLLGKERGLGRLAVAELVHHSEPSDPKGECDLSVDIQTYWTPLNHVEEK